MNIDEAVITILQSARVDYRARLVGATKRDNWECDAWRVAFGREEFDYFTGVGLRKGAKPITPTAASVLYSLVSDSSAADESFADWCDEYGYSSDSIKTFDTYRACCENTKRLRKVFTHAQLAELGDVLRD